WRTPEQAQGIYQQEQEARERAKLAQQQKEQAEREAQWAASASRNEQPRYREVNGRVYDSSPAITFANEKPPVILVPQVSSLRSIGGNFPPGVAQSQQREFEAQQKYQAEMAKWGKYLIRGKIMQVLPDGLLVHCESKIVFVKNYPLPSAVVDGDAVNFVAMPVGSYSYMNTAGARTTVRAYDFGTAPSGTGNAVLVEAGSAG